MGIRNIRQDFKKKIDSAKSNKEISEDEERRASDDIQKLTDKYIASIDSKLEAKEKELMEI